MCSDAKHHHFSNIYTKVIDLCVFEDPPPKISSAFLLWPSMVTTVHFMCLYQQLNGFISFSSFHLSSTHRHRHNHCHKNVAYTFDDAVRKV